MIPSSMDFFLQNKDGRGVNFFLLLVYKCYKFDGFLNLSICEGRIFF